jgi:hypothetical protein
MCSEMDEVTSRRAARGFPDLRVVLAADGDFPPVPFNYQ